MITIQVHKYTKSIKKKKNTASIQADKSPERETDKMILV